MEEGKRIELSAFTLVRGSSSLCRHDATFRICSVLRLTDNLMCLQLLSLAAIRNVTICSGYTYPEM